MNVFLANEFDDGFKTTQLYSVYSLLLIANFRYTDVLYIWFYVIFLVLIMLIY